MAQYGKQQGVVVTSTMETKLVGIWVLRGQVRRVFFEQVKRDYGVIFHSSVGLLLPGGLDDSESVPVQGI
jgi:hypothetical protein